MQGTLNQFLGYVPSLVGAIVALIVGWLVAIIASRIVRAVLHRLNVDARLGRSVPPGDRRPPAVENLVSGAVYYLILLFAIVAFLQALGLVAIVTPLNALLVLVLGFLPRLLSAGALALIAWIVARVLRAIVGRAAVAARLDERMGNRAAAAEGRAPVSNTLGEVVYWVVWLLFLPAILDALNLQGLLAPVQVLLNQVLGFLPNLFSAIVILAIGWFVARLVQRIVTNLLAAIGTDRLSERVGLSAALGQQSLSGLLGLVVYVFVLIPVLVAALNALKLDAVTAPLSNMLNQILAAVPHIFAAMILLGITFVVARVIARLVASLLAGVGFDAVLARLGLVSSPTAGAVVPSEVVGNVVLVALMLFATISALRLLGFDQMADLVAQFVVFASHILVGLIIFAIGLYLANLAARAIMDSGTQYPRLLALLARVAILVLVGAMALRQMGLANEIINLAFGLLLGAIAVATAIAFGLGGRGVAAETLEEWRRTLRTRGDVPPTGLENPPVPPMPGTPPPTSPLP